MIPDNDISKRRPAQPEVICVKCFAKDRPGTPTKVESTALHFGNIGSRYGVLLIRVECHGEKQDIAASFDWLRSNNHTPIAAFDDHHPNDYGLRNLVERDGFSLPTNLQQCAWQLEAPLALPGPAADVDQWIEKNRDWLTRNDVITVRKFAEEFKSSMAGEARSTGKTDTIGKYVLARFVRRMDEEIIANEHKGDWNKRRAEPVAMSRRIIKCAQELAAMIKRSEFSMVATGPITELCADLANLSMKAYELFGTPVTRPERWINDVLPNAAAGTKHDLPMRSEEIDIKPDRGHIQYRADDLRLRCARCQCLESSEEWQKECPGLVLESSSQVALGSGLPGDQGYQ